MKFRRGFVSNSSSSSIICDVCGNEESGWDWGNEEAGMYDCENGHTFCENHAIKLSIEDMIEKIKSDGEVPEDIDFTNKEKVIEIFEKLEDLRDSYPTKACPVCQFKTFQIKDILGYILKTKNINQNDIENEIKEKFKSYNEFKDFIK